MSIDTLRRFGLFLLLCLAQVLVFNRIQLFHCATPLLYVYFAVLMPYSHPRWATLLWCFSMGFIIDMFANTPGVASASMTVCGLIQPLLLPLFLPHDAEEGMPVSASRMGWSKFATLTAIITLVYCLLFFTLETFSFFNFLHWLACVGGSAVITFILILTLESTRK